MTVKYMVYSCKIPDSTEKDLNELAEKGWRVVCSFGDYGTEFILINDVISGVEE